MQPFKTKNYSDCYLYGMGDYEKNIYEFFIKSKVLDKNSEAFADIKYDVKRLQPSTSLTNTLESPNVILLYHDTPLPRAFKVFTAKDLKSGDKKLKVFIDVGDIISTKGGKITIHPSNMDKFISYLTSALMMRIYYSYPEKLLNRDKLVDVGTTCFAEMFTYIIDFLRLSGTDKLREKCMYISSIYYQVNILNKEYSPAIERRAKSISKIQSKDVELLDIQLESDTYKNISTLIPSVAKIINAADSLKLDNFMNKWITLYGTGTQFATEYYPAFSSMLTNAYNGSYLNSQKIIEKICGRHLVEYTTEIFRIGDELV